jgi:hypothetical protein
MLRWNEEWNKVRRIKLNYGKKRAVIFLIWYCSLTTLYIISKRALTPGPAQRSLNAAHEVWWWGRGSGVLVQIINPHSPKWHWKCWLRAAVLARVWYPSRYMWRGIPPRRLCDVIFSWLFLPWNSSWELSSVTTGQPSTRIRATWWLSSSPPFVIVTQKQCLTNTLFLPSCVWFRSAFLIITHKHGWNRRCWCSSNSLSLYLECTQFESRSYNQLF